MVERGSAGRGGSGRGWARGGATALEYVLLLVLILMACFGVLLWFSDSLSDLFEAVTKAI
jgi:Flp pilus assembly pilin Flp